MKIVHSRRANAVAKVPIRGGFRVEFENGRAIVPDEVADVLVGMGGGFYHVSGPLLPALQGARILVIRDSGLGDLLMMTPLLRALRALFDAVVDVLTHERYRCIFQGNPSVRQTFALEREYEFDRTAYDVVLDLRLVVENAEAFGFTRHRADAFAAYADIMLSPAQRTPDYFVSDEERAEELVTNIRDSRETFPEWKGVVAYVWRSSTSTRNWSEATHAAALGALIDAGYAVIVLDHEPQRVSQLEIHLEEWHTRLTQLTDLTGELSLREVAAVMDACDVVITPDTGLFHLAGALDRPTVAYFGAFPAEERQAHTSLTVLNSPGNCALFPCRGYRCLRRDENGQPVCLDVAPFDLVAAVEAAITKAVTSANSQADALRSQENLDDSMARPEAIAGTPANVPTDEGAARGDHRDLDGASAPTQGQPPA